MQRRSASRRRSTVSKPPFYRNKRIIAIGAAGVALVSLLAVTQISDASTRRQREAWQRANCGGPATATANAPQTGSAPGQATTGKSKKKGIDPKAGDVPITGQTAGTLNGGVQNGRQVTNYVGDGQDTNGRRWHRPGCPTPSASAPSTAPTTAPAGGGQNGQSGDPTAVPSGSTDAGNGGSSSAPAQPSASASTTAPLEILGNDCSNSKLAPHTGFQDGNRCVSTAFGEVGTAANNPTLLIVDAPTTVQVGQAFTLKISTRNLVRDRFLAAAQGGYYLESSFLTDQGLVRGHFHTACRMLPSTDVAPAPDPVPAFFVATEDKGGSATPDVITINVSGMPSAGTAQCASWAGDGSHRIPMMQTAKQIPAFDSVRITVQ
jgi:hypothetical protein